MTAFLELKRTLILLLLPVVLLVTPGCLSPQPTGEILPPCSTTPFNLVLSNEEDLLAEGELVVIREFVEERYPGVRWESGGLVVTYRRHSVDPKFPEALGLCWGESGVAEVYVIDHWMFPGLRAIALANTTAHEIGHYVGLEHIESPGACMGMAVWSWGLEKCHCGSEAN